MEGRNAEGAVDGGALTTEYESETENDIERSRDVRETLSYLLGRLSRIEYRLEQIEAKDADDLRDQCEYDEKLSQNAHTIGVLEYSTESNARDAERALDTTDEVRQEIEDLRRSIDR